jgi:hypothetical protein
MKMTLVLLLSLTLILLAFIPFNQDSGIQSYPFQNVSVNATPQSVVVPCSHPAGMGRNTMVVHNGGTTGVVTITAELREDRTLGNFTSGYMAVNHLNSGTRAYTYTINTSPGGAFCHITAVATTTQAITVSLRRE